MQIRFQSSAKWKTKPWSSKAEKELLNKEHHGSLLLQPHHPGLCRCQCVSQIPVYRIINLYNVPVSVARISALTEIKKAG